MSVKTYQHRKAIGHARATARAAMHPILRDLSGQDVVGGADTAYGPERASVGSTITCNPATGDGLLAVGRLERFRAESSEQEVRLVHKEAYTLYWLPWGWDDYAGNPQEIGSEINTGDARSVNYLTSGTRVWIVLDTDSMTDIGGKQAHEFVVMESRRPGPGDVVEFEAVVVRSEGVKPRQVIVA